MSILKTLLPAIVLSVGLAAGAQANPWVSNGSSSGAQTQQAASQKAEKPKAPYVGHYSGKLYSQGGEVVDAELSLDNYKCFVLSVMKDQGLETGFVEMKGKKIILKHTDGKAYRVFTMVEDGKLVLKSVDGKDVKQTDACCTLVRD